MTEGLTHTPPHTPAYLMLIFLLAILIPACDSSSLAFCMMCSAYKLNKPCHTPFPIWNHSAVSFPVLTVVSWPTYRFLRRQVRGSVSIPISFRIFHSLLWWTQSKALAQSMKQKWMFFGILLLSPLSVKCWQFDLWFLCLFETQFVHLEVLGSHTAEA